MFGAKPINGYPSRTAAILSMLESGMSRQAIARELEISTSTVGVLIHSATRRSGSGDDGGRPPSMVSINYDVMRELRPHARRRCTTTLALAQQLIETVVEAGLIDAVLDDGAA